MIEFGSALKQARESAGITLEQLYEQTRIGLKHLRAIEAGNFPAVPQTYIRAFIREYARVVGLDEDGTIRRYNELAEAHAGVPRPPEAIDASNILPQPDDTIEIIPSSEDVPRHVEVVGRPEVDEEEFIPPVRRSPYVTDQDAAPIDIRTHESRVGTASPDIQSSLTRRDTAPASASASVPASSAERTGPDSGDAAGAVRDSGHAPHTTPDPLKDVTGSSSGDSGTSDVTVISDGARANVDDAEGVSSRPSTRSEILEPDPSSENDHGPAAVRSEHTRTEAEVSAKRAGSVYDLKPPIPGETSGSAAAASSGSGTAGSSAPGEIPSTRPEKQPAAGTRPRVSSASDRSVRTPSPSPPPPSSALGSGTDVEQRRILLAGSIIVVMIIIGAVALYYFTSVEQDTGGLVDSTSIRASIDAGKFIDSAQSSFAEPLLPREDTAQAPAPPEERALEPTPKTFAREDSLVLEAFSSSPVWFSVRMDTTRSERGTLGTNEHRVWKARDRFVITLGDAGAVTFFLNGKEIGTLGEEGVVVKNVPLTRQSAQGDQ